MKRESFMGTDTTLKSGTIYLPFFFSFETEGFFGSKGYCYGTVETETRNDRGPPCFYRSNTPGGTPRIQDPPSSGTCVHFVIPPPVTLSTLMLWRHPREEFERGRHRPSDTTVVGRRRTDCYGTGIRSHGNPRGTEVVTECKRFLFSVSFSLWPSSTTVIKREWNYTKINTQNLFLLPFTGSISIETPTRHTHFYRSQRWITRGWYKWREPT